MTVNVASGEMVSLTVTAGGPTMGAPQVWYCSDDGVKQVESYGTPVQCLKNSMVVGIGAFVTRTGLTDPITISQGIFLHQITDNATARTSF